MRRYDIDWIRVIAIGLLIIYHSAIAFQPWGSMIGFPTSKESWTALWMPMAILNVWRIPLLFFVSGMGVYFAMQSRTWTQLLGERSRRIMIPYLFGMLVIVPIQVSIWRMKPMYVINPAHLWFLGNIMAYVVIFFPLFYYLKNKNIISRIFASPFSILIPMIFLMAEKWIINPLPYELYAMTLHGFFLGLIAFFFGFCFACAGEPFFKTISKMRWILLAAAAVLGYLRLGNNVQSLIPIESVSWILFIFSIGYQYLNKPGKALSYLSEAAYPVYVLHMMFQFLFSIMIFQLDIPVPIKFVLLVILTLAGSIATFQLIKQTNITRFLFGLKPTHPRTYAPTHSEPRPLQP